MPNFTFIFLSRTPCPPIFNLQVDAPSNNPYLTNTFKKFKSICPSLICYNLIESSFKYPEAAKFIETALCFKSYKLLRQILFRTTNKPLDILRTSSLRVPLRPSCASKDLTEINFFFNWGTNITSFNSLIISSNNLMRIEPIPLICHVYPFQNDTKPPSSFSKLENHYRLGQTW